MSGPENRKMIAWVDLSHYKASLKLRQRQGKKYFVISGADPSGEINQKIRESFAKIGFSEESVNQLVADASADLLKRLASGKGVQAVNVDYDSVLEPPDKNTRQDDDGKIKWIDMSFYGVSIFSRKNNDEQYLVVQSATDKAIGEKLTASFLAIGFYKEPFGMDSFKLIAKSTIELKKKLASIPKVKIIDIIESDIVEKQIDSASNAENNNDKTNITETENDDEQHANGSQGDGQTSQGVSGRVLPELLSGNGGIESVRIGAGSSSLIDAKGDSPFDGAGLLDVGGGMARDKGSVPVEESIPKVKIIDIIESDIVEKQIDSASNAENNNDKTNITETENDDEQHANGSQGDGQTSQGVSGRVLPELLSGNGGIESARIGAGSSSLIDAKGDSPFDGAGLLGVAGGMARDKGNVPVEEAVRPISGGSESIESQKNDLNVIANRFDLEPSALQYFVEITVRRLIFDATEFGDLLSAKEFGWKEKSRLEINIARELIPVLEKISGGRNISGLQPYIDAVGELSIDERNANNSSSGSSLGASDSDESVNGEAPGIQVSNIPSEPNLGEMPAGINSQLGNAGLPEDEEIDYTGLGDYRTKGQLIADNMAAIKLIKELDRESRVLTKEEIGVLNSFSGWGSLKNVFSENLASKQKQEIQAFNDLKLLLSDDEMFWARQGILNQFFTPPGIIESMYKVLEYAGFSGGNVIEPTVGVGHMIGLMPSHLREKSDWFGSEIDPIVGKIAQRLYPRAAIDAGTSFQSANYLYNRFDLAIGNPPFGDERISDPREGREEIDGFNIHSYMISKSSLHIKKDGMVAMLVTSGFLDSNNSEARDFLSKRFDLVAAFRLPNNAFFGTKITTDIIFLQKRSEQDSIPDPSQTWTKNDGILVVDGSEIKINQYFVENPHMMLGTPSMEGKMYMSGNPQFTLLPNGRAIPDQINEIISSGKISHVEGIMAGLTPDPFPSFNGIASRNSSQKHSVAYNNFNIPVGGFVFDENRNIFMRDDDDRYGNTVLTNVNPRLKWSEKKELGEARYQKIKGLLELRECAYRLVDAERSDSFAIENHRLELNELYDEFVEKFGYINDPSNISLLGNDVKIEAGLEKNYKSAVSSAKASKRGGSAVDSFAEKADILVKRIFYPKIKPTSAKDAFDGHSICIAERGKLDLPFIAELTNKTVEEVISDLSDSIPPVIFKDPKTGEWIEEGEYLSGNVKEKLYYAKLGDKEYIKNVEALEAVQPPRVPASDIFIDIGQTWIPISIYKQFLVELGMPDPNVFMSDYLGSFEIISTGGESKPTILSDDIANDYASIGHIFEAAANKKPIIIYSGTGDDRHVDKQKTSDVAVFVKKMTDIFRDWILANDEHVALLEDIYNETQNTTIERKFNGKILKFNDTSPEISLRNTQANAALRIIQTESILLDHVVGSGKTYTLIAGAMEKIRIGLVKKVLISVPNHLVTQWAQDVVRLYPAANILAASEKSFSMKNRRSLFANITTGNYEIVIAGESSLKFIALSIENQKIIMTEELKELQNALKAAKAAAANKPGNGNGKEPSSRAIRTLANRIAKKIEKLDRLNKSKKDDVVTFEEMGFDMLIVDESHGFKNLEYSSTMSRVAGMGNPVGSQKAFDLYMKINYLKSINGTIAFATGTPISNSLVELYSIMRFLDKKGLEDRNIYSFDSWVKNHAAIQSVVEYTATNMLKERAVMASFSNIPELMQLYTSFADVITMSDLKNSYTKQIERHNEENGTDLRAEFPVPKIMGGGIALNIEEPNKQQIMYMDYLIERSLKIEDDRSKGLFDPRIDNSLWIYSDASKAALDIRVVDPTGDDDPRNKTSVAAELIYEQYIKWNADKGTQLVFCDMSTPSKIAEKKSNALIKNVVSFMKLEKDDPLLSEISPLTYQEKWSKLKETLYRMADEDFLVDIDSVEKLIIETEEEFGAFIAADTGFSVYDDLKTKLMSIGIPEHEIQFIHDYEKAADKKTLFDQVNNGAVRVLIGSTPKMGAGTNVQERLVWLHHLDASMHKRKSDIDQRIGRIERQGNMLYERDPDNFFVGVTAFSTAKTFDAVAWQTLARKSQMVEAFRGGLRSIVEEKQDSASYMEFMAETTGNPIFRRKIVLEKQILEMETEERRVKSKLSWATIFLESKDAKLSGIELKIDEIKLAASLVGKEKTIDGKETFTYLNNQYAKDFKEIHANELKKLNDEKLEYEKASFEYSKSVKQYETDLANYKSEMDLYKKEKGKDKGKGKKNNLKKEDSAAVLDLEDVLNIADTSEQGQDDGDLNEQDDLDGDDQIDDQADGNNADAANSAIEVKKPQKPEKPLPPEKIKGFGFSSSRFDHSEEAIFLRKLREDIYLLGGSDEISFMMGKLEFTVERHQVASSALSYYILSDEYGVIDAKIANINTLMDRIREVSVGESAEIFTNLLKEAIERKDQFLANVVMAERLVESSKKRDAGELKALIDEYKGIMVIVEEVEKEEQVRRLSTPNKYMLADKKRFTDKFWEKREEIKEEMLKNKAHHAEAELVIDDLVAGVTGNVFEEDESAVELAWINECERMF